MKYISTAIVLVALIVGLTATAIYSPRKRPAEAPAHTNFSSPSSEVASIKSATFLMNISAYCICEKCCSKKWADGITASGVPATGRICAAPPEYPFGTVFDVEGMGEYVCEDRGGVIKGNKLDLLFETHAEALEFGRKDLKVTIVRWPEAKFNERP